MMSTMMVSRPHRRICSFHHYKSWRLLALMSMFTTPTAVSCLSLLPSCGHRKSYSSSSSSCHRRAFLRHQATAAVAIVTTILGVQQEPALAAGFSAQQSLPLDSSQKLALRAATEEQPRIPLPDSVIAVSSASGPQPVVQGLIYLQNPRTTRPPVGSVILVTVKRVSSASSAQGGGTLLAAAQFPVNAGKLPVRFQFTKDNFEKRRVTSKQELDTILDNEDLLVEAICCPAENVDRSTATCLVTSPIGINEDKDDDDDEIDAAPFEFLSASGIAKLLRLPGKEGDNNAVMIRAAVSLPLHV